ncbi:MAG: type I-C CRISPR-associated protein Cas7/Csd2 [Nitrospirae bacterium]|nr:type I-C CRISPR-associated protein Cas7/Csd2 [Magnetococcales bacterium]
MNNRYDFIYLFDVRDGNPNGDPDAGNLPRVDAETGHGLVTDVCLKRKIRNYVQLSHGIDHSQGGEENPQGYDIYVREKAILNQQHERAYIACGFPLEGEKKRKGGGDDVEKAKGWMCRNFYDVRAFGAVMTTGVNCGQVRGPVQFTFGRSVDPVITAEHSITRMAVTTKEEADKQGGDNRTMGRKFTIPYGLYRTHGFVSAPLAAQTGFSDADVALLWRSLEVMFEHDRSAARGEMTPRRLLIFRHETPLGNAPAHVLFDRVTVVANPERLAADRPPRSFSDYQILLDGQLLEEKVRVGDSLKVTEDGKVTLVRRL